MNPKVFISHATEDKDRFVRAFARQLRFNGIDAWVDEWEIHPGDSLVQKVFNEGLRNASAVIVVLSKNSVNKPWVREELDAAFVKRVTTGSKLIPVVLDDCAVPFALQSTLWQKIPDTTSFQKELDRIIRSILGATAKPPLGPLPKFSQTLITTFPDLAQIDAVVLNRACEALIEKDDPECRLRSNLVFEPLKADGVSEEAIEESLEVLDGRGYVNGTRAFRGGIPLFTVSRHAFGEYIRTRIHDYPALVARVATEILNSGLKNSQQIATKLAQPHIYIAHILLEMQASNLVSAAKLFQGPIIIKHVSAELKRRLQD
jgi:hypothetical protein